MQIKYSEYHPDPNLRNVTRSIDNASGRAAVGSGLAIEVPYKTYQSRLSAEGKEQTIGAVQNVNVIGVEWGFDGSCSQFKQPVIIKKEGSSVTYYDGPVKDTPPSIVKQFNDAVGTPLTAEQIEQHRDQQARENNQRIANEQAEKLGMAKYRRT